jgi:hypothetical protein
MTRNGNKVKAHQTNIYRCHVDTFLTLDDRRAVRNTRATEKPGTERVSKAIIQTGKEGESETAWSSDWIGLKAKKKKKKKKTNRNKTNFHIKGSWAI